MLIKLYSEGEPLPTTVIIRDANGKISNKPTEEDILYIKLYTTVRSQQELDAINELKGIDLLKFYMSATITYFYNMLTLDKVNHPFILKLKQNFEKLLTGTSATTIDVVEALVVYANLEKYMLLYKFIE
ncbi:MAG: hypothetical protein ACTSVB_02630 [Candidatus Heimdallarchaeaceae archaeon]